jgi:hypothetical protein
VLIEFVEVIKRSVVTVRGRSHHGFSADVATGTRSVLDDEWLAKPFGQPLSYQAAEDIRPAAGGLPNNHAYRSTWIGLRACDLRQGYERTKAGCRMQEAATVRAGDHIRCS